MKVAGFWFLLSIPHGGSAGNILRTGVLRRVLERDDALHAVVVSPLVRDPAFVKEFEHPRIRFEHLPPYRPTGLEASLLSIIQARYLDSKLTETMRIKLAIATRSAPMRLRRLKAMLGRLLAPAGASRGSWYGVSDALLSHPEFDRLFECYRPSLALVATPGLILAEIPFLRTAVRHRVRTMAIDLSWDNLTNKLLPPRRVDRLVVWSELMRAQAVELHGYAPEEVRVAGAPQFDNYFRREARSTREEFFRRIGADPGRRLITVATIPRELYAHHPRVVTHLARAIANDALIEPSQVLVRLHPRDDLEGYAGLLGLPHVIVEKPFRQSLKTGDGFSVDVMTENTRHLGDTMCYSDVVVNVASTIAIEACIFDTPVVSVGFDGEKESPFLESARRYYAYNHYSDITKHGAVGLAESPEQMIELVNAYLRDPAGHGEGRRRVVLEQCQFLDGRSSERVAQCVLAELEELRPMQSLHHVQSVAGPPTDDEDLEERSSRRLARRS